MSNCTLEGILNQDRRISISVAIFTSFFKIIVYSWAYDKSFHFFFRIVEMGSLLRKASCRINEVSHFGIIYVECVYNLDVLFCRLLIVLWVYSSCWVMLCGHGQLLSFWSVVLGFGYVVVVMLGCCGQLCCFGLTSCVVVGSGRWVVLCCDFSRYGQAMLFWFVFLGCGELWVVVVESCCVVVASCFCDRICCSCWFVLRCVMVASCCFGLICWVVGRSGYFVVVVALLNDMWSSKG